MNIKVISASRHLQSSQTAPSLVTLVTADEIQKHGYRAELSAGLYNLLDKNYADPGAEEHLQDSLRQDGRNFRVKLTFRF